MESVTTEREVGIGPATATAEEWREAEARVLAYLGAWQVGEAAGLRECASEIVQLARERTTRDSGLSPLEAALDEADVYLSRCIPQTVASASPPAKTEATTVPLEGRVGLLLGAPSSAPSRFSDRTQMIAAARQGALVAAQAWVPSRPPETRAMAMQTSLSRLPSIQLIAGWILLIAVLVFVFFLTR